MEARPHRRRAVLSLSERRQSGSISVSWWAVRDGAACARDLRRRPGRGPRHVLAICTGLILLTCAGEPDTRIDEAADGSVAGDGAVGSASTSWTDPEPLASLTASCSCAPVARLTKGVTPSTVAGQHSMSPCARPLVRCELVSPSGEAVAACGGPVTDIATASLVVEDDMGRIGTTRHRLPHVVQIPGDDIAWDVSCQQVHSNCILSMPELQAREVNAVPPSPAFWTSAWLDEPGAWIQRGASKTWSAAAPTLGRMLPEVRASVSETVPGSMRFAVTRADSTRHLVALALAAGKLAADQSLQIGISNALGSRPLRYALHGPLDGGALLAVAAVGGCVDDVAVAFCARDPESGTERWQTHPPLPVEACIR